MSFYSGKAYPPEFYYDTYNPLWQSKASVYSYSLQWTQMNPDAVDRILAYRLGLKQVIPYTKEYNNNLMTALFACLEIVRRVLRH